jgi:hypothetical protein
MLVVGSLFLLNFYESKTWILNCMYVHCALVYTVGRVCDDFYSVIGMLQVPLIIPEYYGAAACSPVSV